MQGDLTTEQFDKVIQLCSILGLQDFHVATELLKQSNWNIQKAIGVEQEHKPQPNINQAPSQPHNNIVVPSNPQNIQQQEYQDMNYENLDEPIDYDYNENDQEQRQFQMQYEYYQQEFEKQERLEVKKKKFDEGFVSIPLTKTKSEYKDDKIEARLVPRKDLERSAGNRLRHQYQTDLLKNSSLLCSRIFSKKSAQLQRYKQSLKNQQNNRKFISHLHSHYNSPINFTFGSFYLQLARSHIAQKPLLVYIHNTQYEDNKILHDLISDKQVGNFANKNCVCFGMFDSADDYQVLQKYAQIKDLPAFAVFRLDKKQLGEKISGVYPVIGKDGKGFIQWLSQMTGVPIPNKLKSPEKNNCNIDKSSLQEIQKIQMSNIIYEQNFEYEQMAKMHQIKRNKSKLRKQQEQHFHQKIEELKKTFMQQPTLQTGVSIQIRFRLPVTGDSLLRVFRLDENVEKMFEYVSCFGRQQFEDSMANFDLTQTFPRLSLQDKKQLKIGEVFEDGAERQNLIVKQL